MTVMAALCPAAVKTGATGCATICGRWQTVSVIRPLERVPHGFVTATRYDVTSSTGVTVTSAVVPMRAFVSVDSRVHRYVSGSAPVAITANVTLWPAWIVWLGVTERIDTDAHEEERNTATTLLSTVLQPLAMRTK